MGGEIRRVPAKRRAVAFAALLLVAAAGWWVLGRSPAPAPSPAGSVSRVAQPATLQAASALPSTATRPEGRALAEATARVAQLWTSGPLRGTQMDGDWGRWVGGRLQPSRSLRLRFDHLLSGLGDVGVADLRPWIAQQVRADLGAAAVDQVLAVWDRYLVALQPTSGIRLDPADAQAWQQASGQLATQRRNALGADWAHAFFADDERAADAFLARRQRAATTQAPGHTDTADAEPERLLDPAPSGWTAAQRAERDVQRSAAFGAEAAARLRADEVDQAAWAQQLAAVRARLAAIAADPQRSLLQRRQAQEDEITRQYSGTALVRARALLAEGP